MNKSKTADAYYAEPHHFSNAIAILRKLALETDAEECCKWGMPVYTINNKNVFGICRFKNHFGIWFYNGAFMDDPENLLENAQEGKTKAMRHWKISDISSIDKTLVRQYLNEAITKHKQGKVLVTSKKNDKLEIPKLLLSCLRANNLQQKFDAFTPYKQKEFCEFIESAKQQKNKLARIEKITPLIKNGIGLNDQYR